METVMTVTDLVRDTCKTATRIVRRGDKITVKSGGKALFKIVPVKTDEAEMSGREYKQFMRDMNKLAEKINPDDNPVIQMRLRRKLA
jgi:antitoxin (DNA-binding transcriptional repressor) of toxin-antitoxin stability system